MKSSVIPFVSCLLSLFLLLPASSSAAVCSAIVDRFDDAPGATACTNAASDCSLRGAVSSAAAGALICFLADGAYVLDSNLLIDKNLHISGRGAANMSITRPPTVSIRLLHIAAGATVSLQNLTLLNGVSYYGDTGGAVRNEGSLTMTNVDVTYCGAVGSYTGGAVHHSGPTLTMTNCNVLHNIAHGAAGLLADAGQVTITGSTFADNTTYGTHGGAIYIDNAALNVSDSAITNNTTQGSGGGVYSQNGDLQFTRSLVADNNATFDGGGLLIRSGSSASLENTTISGNRADGHGGGLSFTGPDTASHLSFCTVTANTADADGDGDGDGGGVHLLMDAWFSDMTFKGSVVAANADGTAAPATIAPDVLITGNYADGGATGGNNLIGDNTGATSLFSAGRPNTQNDYTGSASAPLSPGLEPLAANGGPTHTHALARTSPLIDRGPAPCTNAANAAVATDQRSEPRPQRVRADIGAFESALSGVIVAPQVMLLEEN